MSNLSDMLETKELSEHTLPDFVRLFEKYKGVWGGCWCMYHHATEGWSKRTPAENRKDKLKLIRAGKSHGVLVYDKGQAVGWCQFGPREELSRIDKKWTYKPIDNTHFWRITCFFVDREYRSSGVARTALDAALDLMKSRGVKT
jgi:ribosomal protein S18 acetylase RimI-like enzyme